MHYKWLNLECNDTRFIFLGPSVHADITRMRVYNIDRAPQPASSGARTRSVRVRRDRDGTDEGRAVVARDAGQLELAHAVLHKVTAREEVLSACQCLRYRMYDTMVS